MDLANLGKANVSELEYHYGNRAISYSGNLNYRTWSQVVMIFKEVLAHAPWLGPPIQGESQKTTHFLNGQLL